MQRHLSLLFQSSHPSNQGLCELGGSGGYDGSGYGSRCVTDVSRAMVWSAAPSTDGTVKLLVTYLYRRSDRNKRKSQCRSHTHEVPTMAAARLQRWALTLSSYSYSMEFKYAKENTTADALSQLPCPGLKSDFITQSERV